MLLRSAVSEEICRFIVEMSKFIDLLKFVESTYKNF